jgi:hypothetical protein
MTTGPVARRTGLDHALQEIAELLAKRRVDEVTDDLDDLAVYRILNNGLFKGLKWWPKAIEEDF